MITEGMFWDVLMAEANKAQQALRLNIVSGYADANMAKRHMEVLRRMGASVSIRLVIGMPIKRDFYDYNHPELCELVKTKPYKMPFECRYLYRGDPIHAKIYMWLDEYGNQRQAFCGSANYTLKGFGFGKSQTEVMEKIDDRVKADQFFKEAWCNSIDCLDANVEDKVRFQASDQESVDEEGGDPF